VNHTVDAARDLVVLAQRIVVLTGAGISTTSGIPDFRGPEGVWTKDPHAEMLSSFDVWLNNPQIRKAAWRSRLERRDTQFSPNGGHFAINDLERRGALCLLVTQNIDGLHHAAGTSSDLIVEIHGASRDSYCVRCEHRQPIAPTLDRVAAGDHDPHCRQLVRGNLCNGILKSATIPFGQSLIASDLQRSHDAARSCDLLLAVGTTLAVYPVAGLLPTAQRNGAKIVIVNGETTALDDLADVVVRGDISEILPELTRD
jgi:NAD-dependent deacetylase